MKLPVKKKHSKKTSRLPAFLLLAVVATMLGTTGTLAKYTSTFTGSTSIEVAAFAGGGGMQEFDLELGDMYPGLSRTTHFTVQNYDGDRGCDVAMDYEIKIVTSGNLPLNFSLVGNGDVDEESTLAGTLTESPGSTPAGKTFLYTGGRLPYAGKDEEGKRKHNYELSVSWPNNTEADSDYNYSGEFDYISVTVTAVQVNPEAGSGGGEESGGGTGQEEPGQEETGSDGEDS